MQFEYFSLQLQLIHHENKFEILSQLISLLLKKQNAMI
jgi:hypothetical protein